MILENEFQKITDENGLIKIFKNVRIQINDRKSAFLQNQKHSIEKFIDENTIDARILPKIWRNLTSLTCKYHCPWCGIKCCGIQNCNDLYEPNARVKEGFARQKHTCQFHRDNTICGAGEQINFIDDHNPGTLTDRLPNVGSCPALIERGISRLVTFNGETKEMNQLYVI